MGRRWGWFVGLGLIGIIIGLFIWRGHDIAPGNCAGSGQADYGDAPDGGPTGYPAGAVQTGAFPSSAASGGPTADVACGSWIGERVTGEAGYTDPADPDPITPNPRPPGTNVPNATSDYDDGIGWVWRPDPGAGPAGIPADLIITVEVSSAQGGNYVVNVLQDLNMDGDWSMDSLGTGGGEWVIANHQFNVGPGLSTVDLPAIRYPTPTMTSMPPCFWMRVVLSTAPIEVQDEFGWSGTGPVGEGEIEDVLLHPTPTAGNCTSSQPMQ